jgi:O-antigen/teichoic acid export membrane protein
MKKTSIKKNIMISISVQLVSLMVSFILSFLVPKFVNEYQYSYWQIYVLYTGYVGILHFGLLDGIVLRYSQYDYDELDKNRIRSQFQLMLALLLFFSFFTIIIGYIFFDGISRSIVILVAISIITKNIMTYNSYSFQITNRINDYALLILAQRVSYGLIAAILLLLHVDNYIYLCLADITGDAIGMIVAAKYNKGMYFGKSIPLLEAIKEWKINVRSGVVLMVANWSALLITGSAKMIIQWHWDTLVFGKISFSFSISNLFLMFVSAISVVLFPSLKRMDPDQLPDLYKKIRAALTPLLFTAMIFYYPGCVILEKFLPQYSASLEYLGILLPIIIYTSKISLLTNNYLKAYRKEKSMLIVNVFSLILALALFTFSAYCLNNLKAVLVSIVITEMMYSMLSETAVTKVINFSLKKEFIVETIMTFIFICSTQLLPFFIAFLVYTTTTLIYVFSQKNKIAALLNLR